jgi:hypothetical protein
MDVSQNLVTLNVTDQQVQTVLTALGQIEAALPGLISMEPADRKGLMIMGPRSEPFARQTLRVLEQNPKIVPPSMDLVAAKADLAAYDRLQPILERLQRLVSRLDDTVTALGSDTMDFCLEGYGQIKLSGGAQGLDDLRRELSGRWAKNRRKPATTAAEPA